MKWIKTILREIYGLFVDDIAFALAILIWLGIVRWAMLRLNIAPAITATILFAGLVLILIESTLRYARRKRESLSKK